MLKMEEFLMIRDLYNKGLNISQIALETGYDRKTVRKYLSAKALPIATVRASRPSKLDGYKEYITQRIADYPLSAARIYREIRERGYTGG
jgi:transposase